MADSHAVDAVEWFLIIAAALFGTSGLLVLLTRPVPAAARIVERALAGQEHVLAAMCAIGLMTGSLFLSEVQHYVPCLFCWYQRIAAYPLAVILVIAVARRGRDHVWPYVLGLSIPGALLSLYHIGLQEGLIAEGNACDPRNPCTTKWAIDDKLGLTIPMMALCGFVFITAMALTALGRHSIDPALDDETFDETR